MTNKMNEGGLNLRKISNWFQIEQKASALNMFGLCTISDRKKQNLNMVVQEAPERVSSYLLFTSGGWSVWSGYIFLF